jgi:clan AA aspartic protease (TIGR02281 family)
MDFGIRACMEEILSNDEADNVFNEDLAYEYCECATIKLYSAGYSYKDLMDIEDQNSEAFNEIVVPCLNDVFNKQTDSNTSNTYVAQDIEGGAYRSLVPLTDYLGLGYKVKITMQGLTKYYLLDTGSSDLLIDRDTERELLLNGKLKREDYLDKTEYILANNQAIQGQKVKIDNITIGDYTVKNVVIAVVDEALLLCGISFLDKFKKWEIDKQNKVLILYK